MKHCLVALAVLLVLIASNTTAQENPEPDTDIYRERGGIRIGYSGTPSDLTKSFGGGLTLALHFIQRIKKPVSVDVSLGAIYLGSTDRSDITRAVFGTEFDNVAMRIIAITAAPMAELPMNDRTSLYFSAGLGLYTISLLLDESIREFDLTNNHFGVNGGIGVLRRLSKNWFFDLNFQIHKFWTADAYDSRDPDWFYVYSEGDSDPLFWAATVGVALRLF